MMISSSFFLRHKGEEAEKIILTNRFIKGLFIFSPCEGVWGSGNRNPETFGSFGYKRTYPFAVLQNFSFLLA